MKVYLLRSGTMLIDRSQVLWNVDCGVRLRFPIYSVLVDHPEGLFLFDSGYDVEHARKVFPREEPHQDESETIAAQLALCAFRPEDVAYIVNSHLHFDHVGGNKLCTAATTVVHKLELREAKVPEPFERLAYSDQSFDHAKARFELLEGDTELAAGLKLFETPGHAIGHYSLLVELKSRRPMLFAFDAAYTHENLERDVISGFHHTPVEAMKSLARLRQLREVHDAELFVAHDMDAFSGYRVAPEFYA